MFRPLSSICPTAWGCNLSIFSTISTQPDLAAKSRGVFVDPSYRPRELMAIPSPTFFSVV